MNLPFLVIEPLPCLFAGWGLLAELIDFLTGALELLLGMAINAEMGSVRGCPISRIPSPGPRRTSGRGLRGARDDGVSRATARFDDYLVNGPPVGGWRKAQAGFELAGLLTPLHTGERRDERLGRDCEGAGPLPDIVDDEWRAAAAPFEGSRTAVAFSPADLAPRRSPRLTPTPRPSPSAEIPLPPGVAPSHGRRR